MPNYEPKGVEWMREIGHLGGVASGARRLDRIDAARRIRIASDAARARWKHPQRSPAEQAAFEQGVAQAAGWRNRAPGKGSQGAAQPGPPDAEAVAVVEAAPDHAQSSPFDLLSRGDLRAAFSLSDSPKAQRFLTCLGSQQYKHWNVATIARRCGVTIGEVFTLWRDRQFLVAMFAMLKAVPEIARRMAEDAAGRTLVCPGCRGMGTIKGREGLECPQCRGTGAVNVPDSEARKLVFEIVGFTGKNLVRLDHGAPNNMGSLESILDDLDRFERESPIEAEFEKD